MFGPSIISVFTTLTLTLSSALAPGPDAPGGDTGSAEAPAPALAQSSYTDALDVLNEADNTTNMDTEAGVPVLLAALAGIQDFAPQLAADPDSLQIRLYARLNLARAYLELKDSEMAAAAMDEAIREAMSVDVPARDFGGKVERLYEKRLEALQAEGLGTLDVTCEPACKVYINETEVASHPTQLLPGTYRVWVEAVNGEREPLRELVVLTAAGAKLVFEKPQVVVPPPVKQPEKLKLILPLGGELGLMFGGAALAAIGAGIATAGSARTGQAGLFATGVAFSMIGVGLLTTGIVTLSFDEKRRAGERVDRTAMLNYTMQF